MQIKDICDICQNMQATGHCGLSCNASLDKSKLPDETQFPQPPTKGEFEKFMKTHYQLPNGSWIDKDKAENGVFTSILNKLRTMEEMLKVLLKQPESKVEQKETIEKYCYNCRYSAVKSSMLPCRDCSHRDISKTDLYWEEDFDDSSYLDELMKGEIKA